ncbi:MAG TPA: response regulator [Pirellulales bacterium]|jgi:carbon storage regulator CsrA|nr:response regulator [Pirellulales bacterium]
MLVLSRRPGDKILFPDLDIRVEILQSTGKNVRVGIDAPSDVAVLRHELARTDQHPRQNSPRRTPGDNHRLRNRLNTARLALCLLEKQLEAGLIDAAKATLVRALEEFAAAANELQPAAGREEAAAKLPRLRALLVEDDANESELLAGILRMSGIVVDTAGDGWQALDYLAHHERPDVVLLDMRMPRFDGPSTISAIRQNPQLQGLKVYAVSGSTPDEVGLPMGPGGVDRWFSKPLDPGRLVREMKHELDAPHASALAT